MNKYQIKQKIASWASQNEHVRAAVLTSSMAANAKAQTDAFSDFDVVVYTNSIDSFRSDEWLSVFGEVLVRWPQKPQSTFDENWLTRLVIFEDRMRIDFQITDKTNSIPADFDGGFEVLADKDGIIQSFPEPTYTSYLITKPTQEQFLECINDYFWDATYVAKYLRRNELFFAKYMFDSALRFEYFEKMIEWHIGSQNNWKVSTNKHGRYFTKYLDQDIWQEVQATFAGSDIDENWQAFLKMNQLFTKLAKELASRLDYQYPHEQETKILEYYKQSQYIAL